MSDQHHDSKVGFWASPGAHLTDEQVTALADGQLDAAGAEAIVHLEQCEACASKVADAATAGAEVHAALRELAADPVLATESVTAPSRARGRRSSNPGVLIAVAMMVALVASLPQVLEGIGGLAHATAAARLFLPAVGQGARTLVSVTSAPAASAVAALVLIAVGAWIAVAASRAARADRISKEGADHVVV